MNEPQRQRPDLRLVGAALGCWTSGFLVVRTWAPLGWGLAAVSAGLAALLAATMGPFTGGRRGAVKAFRRDVGQALGWSAVAVLLGVFLGAAAAATRVAQRDADPVKTLARTRQAVRVMLVVTDDPRPVQGSSTVGSLVVPARLTRVETGVGDGPEPGHVSAATGMTVSARVVVFATGATWRRLLPGQHVMVAGRMSLPRGRDLTAALLSAKGEPIAVEPAPWHQRAAHSLRAGLRRACAPLPVEPGGLLPGLVLGDTGNLDPALAEDFRSTGMTHLYAVSGANCAIVMGAVLLACRYCRAGPRLACLASLVALVGFVVLVRPSPSVLRAAVMTGLGLIALAIGRPSAAMPALATSVLFLVVADPQLAVDAGFALSVAATAGLLLIAPAWARRLRRCRVPAGVAEALAATIAAQLACAPIIAALTGTVSVIAVPANLLAAPAVAPATILGVITVLVSPLWPAGAQYVAWLASWPARWLVLLARLGVATPSGVVGWPAGTGGGLLLAAVLLAAAVIFMIRRLRRLAITMAVASLVGVVPVRCAFPPWPPAGWFVVACEVGQGDAIVLRAGPHQAVVVDVGPQPGPVDKCLRALGVDQVALVLLTHCHADHVGGIAGVLRERPVAGLVMPPEVEDKSVGYGCGGKIQVGEVPTRIGRAGDRYRAGRVRLTVLGPVLPLAGTRSDSNNNSLVVRAEVAGHSVLLPGDAEAEEQSSLLTAGIGPYLAADVLKVAHHGSGYQDEGFLAAARCSAALVSVGRGNRLGHPAMSVLTRLADTGTTVKRTDLDGTVAVTGDAGRMSILTRHVRPAGRPP